MPTLAEQLTKPEKRSIVIKDLATLVDQEVSHKGGLSGLGIKAAYSVVKAIKPTFITEVLDGMFDDCVARLEPTYASYEKKDGGPSLAKHFVNHSSTVADALLFVTDQRAERTTHQTAKKAYLKLRPAAKRNVEDAVPRLGELVERHTRA